MNGGCRRGVPKSGVRMCEAGELETGEARPAGVMGGAYATAVSRAGSRNAFSPSLE